LKAWISDEKDFPYKQFSTQKASEFLGWQPKTTLEEGMKKTTQWLKEEVYKK
jgi:nucleoside-diphosphate-sugar epimerase